MKLNMLCRSKKCENKELVECQTHLKAQLMGNVFCLVAVQVDINRLGFYLKETEHMLLHCSENLLLFTLKNTCQSSI